MIEKLNSNQLLAGVAGILALGIFFQAMGLPSFGSKEAALECQGAVRSQQSTSKDDLARLIQIDTGNSKEAIRKLLKEPYCVLPSISVRTGAPTDREVYRVASDALEKATSQTYLVVSYEGNQYQGYRFWIR
ncbi:hypothetical protein [Leptolyngbya sp. NIES-2104]|uniref:hypothetical protein n=1 Tax=Leptolyngbya sp. NIES-2104 TaxID=1552121 RepID=UPI0006EC5868|nr:hypothetical protein [Leptolyngbya sp. NIES-2104]GAP98312.1 hypothetical protein NIES2104_48660 [Leptolyngbya sp. NIES-2104]